MKKIICVLFGLSLTSGLFANESNTDKYYIQALIKSTGLKDTNEIWKFLENASYESMAGHEYFLGTLIRKTPQDYKEIIKYSKKICAGDYSYGCNLIGFLYSDGKKIKKDIKFSKEYFDKSCKLGDDIGCKNR
ncbi:hypothetical protein O6B97_08245 [Campylobacter ureolyticus]|uniref:hypothetical protein n=1 Tax=Campylobacter ureolyticus TaxID=827 RepID=UPI001FC8062C|nr:hypothetical protein [Campylobacter ureolyticus]MCZ6104968.1 hypothetical protein [Campylobacter ureolyticus]MCZ6187076.1 hypothetical protein [Campylobacter ureolyticus]GKH61323.1 hypothetical protein CE91St25_16590 [Campylobacter ureolyticus]